MAIGSSHLLKGALIHFSAPMLVPVPNVIVFQYNPEKMTRKLAMWKPGIDAHKMKDGAGHQLDTDVVNQLAQPFDPIATPATAAESVPAEPAAVATAPAAPSDPEIVIGGAPSDPELVVAGAAAPAWGGLG